MFTTPASVPPISAETPELSTWNSRMTVCGRNRLRASAPSCAARPEPKSGLANETPSTWVSRAVGRCPSTISPSSLSWALAESWSNWLTSRSRLGR